MRTYESVDAFRLNDMIRFVREADKAADLAWHRSAKRRMPWLHSLALYYAYLSEDHWSRLSDAPYTDGPWF